LLLIQIFLEAREHLADLFRPSQVGHGVGVHIMSIFSSDAVENELKQILSIPKHLKIAFAARMGYPASGPTKYLRVRRDVQDFAHFNAY
jgi:hypothetical protein